MRLFSAAYNIMKNNGYIKKFISLIVVVVVLLLYLYGCGQKEQEQPAPRQQAAEQEEEPGKVPDELKGIEESIERIIKAMDGPAVAVEEEEERKPEADTQQQAGNEGQGKQQQGGGGENQGGSEEEGGQKQGEGGGGQKQGQDQKKGEEQPQQQDPWQKITPVINEMHYRWNSYMPSAAKKGANKKLIDNFSNALNSLTSTIIGKNKTNTMMAASYLYAYIPDFYALYKTNPSPEIKRIRYYTRNAILNGLTGNWTQADYDIGSLKSSWSMFKNTVDKEQQESANKLDFSIYELEKVIKERNKPLTDIKGRVSMANVEALEKAMEEGQEGGGQQGGGQGGGGQQGGGQGGGQ